MRKLIPIVAVLTLAMVLPVGAASAKAPLRATTTHELAAPQVDGDYMLAWTGTITGDINGTVQWWIDMSTWTLLLKPDSPAKASHYTMKTIVKDATGNVILETLERGTTTMANFTWRANGVVTYADPDLFPGWEGRRVHEAGDFRTDVIPWTGTSTFRVN